MKQSRRSEKTCLYLCLESCRRRQNLVGLRESCIRNQIPECRDQMPRNDRAWGLHSHLLFASNGDDRAELRLNDHSFHSFRHSFRALILDMVKETAVVETRRGARCDPGGTGMLKARFGVHVFACWPRRSTFAVQDFRSLWPLPTLVAAERTGSTEMCPTPTSSRGRRHGSCTLVWTRAALRPSPLPALLE